MKLAELIKIRGILLEIKSIKMPLKTSYNIAKFLRETDEPNNFYNEKYSEIVTQYAEKDEMGKMKSSEDGKSIKISQEEFDLCISALKELEEIEVNIPDIHLDPIELEHTGLTIEQIYTLMPILM